MSSPWRRRLILAVALVLAGFLFAAVLDSDEPLEDTGAGLRADAQSAPASRGLGRTPHVPIVKPAVRPERRSGRLPKRFRRPWMSTDWQQRMATGEVFLRVQRELGAGSIEVGLARKVLDEWSVDLLFVERWWRWRRKLKEADVDADTMTRTLLRRVTEPGRHRDAFVLHGTRAQMSRYGETCLVRVWTPKGQGFPVERVREAETLLNRLGRRAGTRKEGYDVLATPKMGADVFPDFAVPRGVVGLYMIFDDLAIIGTDHPPRELQRLLNHELVHAWQMQAREDWKHRFVQEGLAEYLAWSVPTDGSLDIPDARLRHNFSFMLKVLDRLADHGVDLEKIDLRGLINAAPSDFYALGWLAYAIAQACFAYIDPQILERALREDDEPQLVAAFHDIDWPTLLTWIRTVAKDGKDAGASFSFDATTRDLAWGRGTGRVLRVSIVRRVFGKGIDADDYSDLVVGEQSDPDLDAKERVEILLSRMLRGKDRVALLVDNTAALDSAVDPTRLDGEVWRAAGVDRHVSKASHVVSRLFSKLNTREHANRALLGSLTNRAVEYYPIRVDLMARLRIPDAVRKISAALQSAQARFAIVVLGAKDAAWRSDVSAGVTANPALSVKQREARATKRRVRALVQLLEKARVRAKAIVVLDPAPGEGEGRSVAEALSRVLEDRKLVAYWPLR